jgi:hypothetical protein
MNKQLSLLRAQSPNTNTSVPYENVTNLLEAAANVLPSTIAEIEDSKSKRVQTLREYVAVESLIISMPMATKIDQRKKIKKLVKTKKIQKII